MAPNASDTNKDAFHSSSKEKDRKKKQNGGGGGNKNANRFTHSQQAAAAAYTIGSTTPTTPSTHRNIRASPKSTPKASPKVLLSNFYNTIHNTPVSVGGANSVKSVNSNRSLNLDMLLFHKEIEAAIRSDQWESVRTHIQQVNHNSLNSLSIESLDSSGQKGIATRVSFWSRISGLRGHGGNGSTSGVSNNDHGSAYSHDRSSLLMVDEEQRTPLHLVVSCRKVPVDIVQSLVTLEQRAVSLPNNCGRLPLHFAIVHRADISVIAALIDAFPAAISFPDSKGLSPLQYAVDIARRDSMKGPQPPRTYWMPLPDFCDEAIWQQEQTERWSVVHWLLLSSATHLQTSLSLGGRKPILVEALVSAASPAVISLLIGASVMLLSHENRATAFAASTLYTCITRHYPLTILKSLANQCPSDVHEVRDETGMGLVAAQFISGCFEQMTNSQELRISEDFYACFNECIQEGEIGDDPVITDWWCKIEYLIAFCACCKQNRSGKKSMKRKKNSARRLDPNSYPSEYLLHAALMNDDTPPSVIRLLLALYPKAITLPDPKTGAFPLHLSSMKHDYIPRFYEVNTTDDDTTMNIILKSDPSAILKRHDGRLPLHYAIESGRTITSLSYLLSATISEYVEGDDLTQYSPLLQRDPITLLYPFLLAASYPNDSEEDSLRWTSVARNKYSNTAWKSLSDRQKACTILRVAELENIARIDTIYELLRCQPEAICCDRTPQINCRAKRMEGVTDNTDILTRDSTGKGVIAEHYISWSYVKQAGTTGEEFYHENSQNQKCLHLAIKEKGGTGSISLLPQDMKTWWDRLLINIQKVFVAETQRQDFEWVDIPYEKNEYLLHIALTNSDTPPQVIEMIMAFNAPSVSLSIPSSSLLPLHIAAQTQSYIPRNFEHYERSSLELVLAAYPDAARVKSNNRLPLHAAILSGKSYYDVAILVDAEPSALCCLDCDTQLYPFQIKASCTKYSSLQRSRFLCIARNKYDEKSWNQLTPQMRTNQVMQVQKEYELESLSVVFMLLRKDPSVFNQLASTFKKHTENRPKKFRLQNEKSLHENTIKSKESDASTDTRNVEDSSFVLKAEQHSSPAIHAKNQLPLMLLLSQHMSKHSTQRKEMFECDASFMSNIDVMSTLTSTLHTEGKLEMTDEDNEQYPSEDDTSYDDFAEDSFVRSSISDDVKLPLRNEKEFATETHRQNNTDALIAVFEMRRTPRTSSGKQPELEGNRSSLKLTKRPMHLNELNSLLLHTTHEKTSVSVSVPSSSSMHTSSSRHSFSYKSSRSDEKRRIRSRAEMEWIIPSLANKPKPSRHNEKSDDEAEQTSVSLSLPSLHPRFTPANLAATPSITTKNAARDTVMNGTANIEQGHSPDPDLHKKQASLLGAYHDTDREEDDPLLILCSVIDNKNVRPSSEHYVPSERARNGLDKRKESFRKYSSEHIAKTSTAQVHSRPKRGTNDARGNTLAASTQKVEISVKSKKYSSTSNSDATDVDIEKEVSTLASEIDHDKCPPTRSMEVRSSSKYFDKATMSWKERIELTKKEVYFDKVEFRWVVKIVTVGLVDQMPRCDDAPQIPAGQMQNPFLLEMRKSKALQISKTVRHTDVTKQRRSSIQGTSTSTKRQRRASVNMDQMKSVISSRNLMACIICQTNKRTVLLVPCSHLCLCESCSEIQDHIDTCPLCACKVSSKMVIA